MLFWLKTIFCSAQMLDVNLLLDLENTSDILKSYVKMKRHNKRIKNQLK